MEALSTLPGTLWGESSGHRWIFFTNANDAHLWCFLWSVPEYIGKQSWGLWLEAPSRALWRHCNVSLSSVWPTWPSLCLQMTELLITTGHRRHNTDYPLKWWKYFNASTRLCLLLYHRTPFSGRSDIIPNEPKDLARFYGILLRVL